MIALMAAGTAASVDEDAQLDLGYERGVVLAPQVLVQAILLPSVAHDLPDNTPEDADGSQSIEHRLRRNGLTRAMICTTPVVRKIGDASCVAGVDSSRSGSSRFGMIPPSRDGRHEVLDIPAARVNRFDAGNRPGHPGDRSVVSSPPQSHEVHDEEGSWDPGRCLPRDLDRLRRIL